MKVSFLHSSVAKQINNLSCVRMFLTKNERNEVIDNQNTTNQYLQHENLRLVFVKVNRGAKKMSLSLNSLLKINVEFSSVN